MLSLSNAGAEGGSPSDIRLRALSLGAGVQSTTLALMEAHGAVGPLPDCAIFADNGWEPRAVYEHLDWLMSPNVLPFPVFIVGSGNMRDNLLAAGRLERWASIPAFARSVGRRGNVSIGTIRRKVRELVELTRKRSSTFAVVEQWIGISFDEVIPRSTRAPCRGMPLSDRCLLSPFRSRVRSQKIGSWPANSAGIPDPAVGLP